MTERNLKARDQVKDAFIEYWDASLFEGWYHNSNTHLNHATPAQFVAAGDIGRVLDAIECSAWGVYT